MLKHTKYAIALTIIYLGFTLIPNALWQYIHIVIYENGDNDKWGSYIGAWQMALAISSIGVLAFSPFVFLINLFLQFKKSKLNKLSLIKCNIIASIIVYISTMIYLFSIR